MATLIKQIIQFYTSNFRDICLITIPFFLPLILLQNLVIPQIVSSEILTDHQILSTFIGWLFFPFYTGALIVNFSSKINNSKKSIIDCLLISLSCWPKLFLVVVITSVLTGLGILVLIIPGIYLFIRLSIAEFYVVLDGLKPIDAIKMSYVKTKELQWQILGTAIVLFIPFIFIRFFVYPQTLTLSSGFGFLQILTLLILCILNVIFTVAFFRFYCLANNDNEEKPNKSLESDGNDSGAVR